MTSQFPGAPLTSGRSAQRQDRAKLRRKRLTRTIIIASVIVILIPTAVFGVPAIMQALQGPEEPQTQPMPVPSVTPTPTPTPTPVALGRDDLAQLPPMGWNSWNQMRCNDLTEAGVKHAADNFIALGLKDAGYEYVVVDDCWQSGRDANGVLIADPTRFPSGMKALGEYIHSKGLKFGIYAVPGSVTCANYWDRYPVPGIGSLGYEQLDAETFASWGVDYLKYDWCRADINDGLDEPAAFSKMNTILLETNPGLVYSISEYGESQPWKWAPGMVNLWRTSHDLHPNWQSLFAHINEQVGLESYAGPGHWNDPDMLQIGNGIGPNETVTHFALWAIMAAPLFLGTNLETLTPAELAVVTNPEMIAIDQDVLGKQGRQVRNAGGAQVWVRELHDGSFAVALFNTTYSSMKISSAFAELGIPAGSYSVRDVVSRKDVGTTTDAVSGTVLPHGTVMYKITPVR